MYESVRPMVSKIGAWAWPLKFMLGAAVSAVAGGGVLGFLLENAAYSFALTYGSRPPVEGVPYLGAMVTFASVSLLLIGAALSLFVVVTIRQVMLRSIEWLDTRGAHLSDSPRPLTLFRSLSATKALLVIVLFNASFSIVQPLLVPAVLTDETLCAWPLLLCAPEKGLNALSYTVSFVVGTITLVMLWRPSLVWLGTLSLVAVYYVWIGMSVLPSEGYARLLRTTGFGGGSRVTLEIAEPASGGKRAIDTFLVIRTATHFIVYDEPRKQIDELPLSQVLRVGYAEGGLHVLPHRLPPKTNLQQR